MIKVEQKKKIDKQEQLNKVINYIEKLMKEGEYGLLKLSFENGNIVNIKLEKNMKITDI